MADGGGLVMRTGLDGDVVFGDGQVVSWDLDSDFTTPTDGWSVTVTTDDPDAVIALRCLPVELSIDLDGEALQLHGRIEGVDTTAGDDGVIKLSGNDRIADLVMCHCDPETRALKGTQIGNFLSDLFAPVGITVIGDDDGKLSRTVRQVVNTTPDPVAATAAAAAAAQAIAGGAAFAGGAVGGAPTTRDTGGTGAGDAAVKVAAVRVSQSIVRAARSLLGLDDPASKTITVERIVGRTIGELEDTKPEEGQSLYDYGDGLCAQFGSMVQPSVARDRIELEAPDYDQEPSGYLVLRIDPRTRNKTTDSNLTDETSATRDDSQLVSLLHYQGTGGDDGETSESHDVMIDVATVLRLIGHEELVRVADNLDGQRKRPGEAGDGRKMYRYNRFSSKEAKTREALEKMASARLSDMLKRSLEYRATVYGFRDEQTGKLYAPNTIVEVHDERNRVFGPLWVRSRKFSYGDQGQRTQLVCHYLGAYQLEPHG